MAAHPIVVVDHGVAEIPKELRNDPRFRDGAKLQLVPLEAENEPHADEQQRWREFLALGGLLADSDFDPNEELEKEKQRELADEARWAKG